jgi:hypothetical protein
MFHERRWSRAAAALSLPSLPGRVVMVGGGYVAVEFAGISVFGCHARHPPDGGREEFVSLRPPEIRLNLGHAVNACYFWNLDFHSRYGMP